MSAATPSRPSVQLASLNLGESFSVRHSEDDMARSVSRGRPPSLDIDERQPQSTRHMTLPNELRSASGLRRRAPSGFTVLSISLADIKWIRMLGEGDYGQVWLCRHEGAKRDMAVKKINEGLLNEESREAFLQEIRLLSSLRHVNLVKVYGACDSPTKGLFLFVELCTGSWRERLDNASPIAPRTLVSVLRGVAAGMCYLHEKGIVHRDLKAANVLLRGARGEDDSEYPVVSDMGLARYVDKDGPAMTVRGTTWVMAPEMLRNRRYDATIDIFAFGVLIAESITRLEAEDIPRTKRFLVDWAELQTDVHITAATADRRVCYDRLLALAVDCCVDEPTERPSFARVGERLEEHAAQLRAEAGEDVLASMSKTAPAALPGASSETDLSAAGKTAASPAAAEPAQPSQETGAAVGRPQPTGLFGRLWRCFSRKPSAAALAAAASAATPPHEARLAEKMDLARSGGAARTSSFRKEDTLELTVPLDMTRPLARGSGELSGKGDMRAATL